MGHFIIHSKTDLKTAEIGTKLEESDYALGLQDGSFVQFKYVEEDKKLPPTIVEPGLWIMGYENNKLEIRTTEFVKEDILTDFIHTKEVTFRINSFFSKLDIYKKYGIEIPKRGILLYGPAGTGKTSSIKLICNQYIKDNKTAIVLWPTDKVSAHDVKDFIKSFEYKGVEKLILVAEDLGGVEVDEVKVESRSSLLSLLDNQEKTFTLPVLILATTNHAEIFNGNITNRPGRFSDKIEVGYPKADARKKLFRFFLKEKATDELVDRIAHAKYEKFSPAHIQEILIRSELYDLSIDSSMDEISAEIKQYNDAFQQKRSIGIDSEY